VISNLILFNVITCKATFHIKNPADEKIAYLDGWDIFKGWATCGNCPSSKELISTYDFKSNE
jgi:hypothetical protein